MTEYTNQHGETKTTRQWYYYARRVWKELQASLGWAYCSEEMDEEIWSTRNAWNDIPQHIRSAAAQTPRNQESGY
ncbi:MAG: hypothetical protein GTO60_16480 [Gammaproteobacteria bacterium]|nr:hypothetical protein [Gammaproteobacteria bacterium]